MASFLQLIPRDALISLELSLKSLTNRIIYLIDHNNSHYFCDEKENIRAPQKSGFGVKY